MKKISMFLFLILSFGTVQKLSCNYFAKQVVCSAVAGGAAAAINKSRMRSVGQTAHIETLILLGAYVGLKFVFDVSQSNCVTDVFKSMFFVPVNGAVAFGSSLITANYQ